MKSYNQGRERGRDLCLDVAHGVASLKRVTTLAKKKLSEYEQGKVDSCVDWLHRNKQRLEDDEQFQDKHKD